MIQLFTLRLQSRSGEIDISVSALFLMDIAHKAQTKKSEIEKQNSLNYKSSKTAKEEARKVQSYLWNGKNMSASHTSEKEVNVRNNQGANTFIVF